MLETFLVCLAIAFVAAIMGLGGAASPAGSVARIVFASLVMLVAVSVISGQGFAGMGLGEMELPR